MHVRCDGIVLSLVGLLVGRDQMSHRMCAHRIVELEYRASFTTEAEGVLYGQRPLVHFSERLSDAGRGKPSDLPSEGRLDSLPRALRGDRNVNHHKTHLRHRNQQVAQS